MGGATSLLCRLVFEGGEIVGQVLQRRNPIV